MIYFDCTKWKICMFLTIIIMIWQFTESSFLNYNSKIVCLYLRLLQYSPGLIARQLLKILFLVL